jgi:SEC-C motif-containing protein
MTENTNCPCGSQTKYENCCKPILDDHSKAVTAESLMRSRYTAFTRKNTKHILRSWHSTVRPKKLNFEDNPVVWIGLEVLGKSGGESDDTAGTVEFTTSYLENGQLCTLRENSEFIREDTLWFYLKGTASLEKKKLERNKPCPCGSGKKFKRCCLAL